MKYVHYERQTGKILGYYATEINEVIPDPNMALSDEAWSEALNAEANHLNLQTKKLYKKEVKIDEKKQQLNELIGQIKECEDFIHHALIIGNTAVLESLRAEYKELIAERERLNTRTEPIMVAPTDHL